MHIIFYTMNNDHLIIQINGEPFNCTNKMSLQEILIYLDIDTHLVLLEYNKEIINEEYFPTTFVKNNDALEIITIVGGG
jgi:sulfur carrier protein